MTQKMVVYGVLGEPARAPHPGAKDKTVAEIAAGNEYGTKTAPARPAFQRARDEHLQEWLVALRRAISDVVDGRAPSGDEALDKVAEQVKADALKVYDDARSWAVPNKPSTARKKGHDQPLIGEHVAVREAIDAEVRDK